MKILESPYPLLFKPVYKDYPWGGDKIPTRFSRTDAPAVCAESWEVSAHPDGMGLVENGEFEGKSLETLCAEFGESILGSYCPDGKFPLLIKLIDAKERLSVQVHPDEVSAERYGGEAKTEMWYILDAPENAFVCAGLNPGVGPRIFHDAIVAKNVEPLLRTVKIVPGKSVFIPGGLVHAICEDSLILEVQQSSNTTYRVYDWGRIGADGKTRMLHIQQAMEVIDWHAPELDLQAPFPMKAITPENKRERLLRCDFFTLEKYELSKREPVTPNGNSFRALFAQTGAISIQWEGGEMILPYGRSCLIPACMPAYSLSPVGTTATVLTVEV